METHTFEDLKTGNLISIAQLCDDDCKVTFDKQYVNVIKNGKIILQGNRDIQTKL